MHWRRAEALVIFGQGQGGAGEGGRFKERSPAGARRRCRKGAKRQRVAATRRRKCRRGEVWVCAKCSSWDSAPRARRGLGAHLRPGVRQGPGFRPRRVRGAAIGVAGGGRVAVELRGGRVYSVLL